MGKARRASEGVEVGPYPQAPSLALTGAHMSTGWEDVRTSPSERLTPGRNPAEAVLHAVHG